MFGALRDAGPDYWGRRVIEKHAGKPTFGEMDYLLESPDDRAGALGFGLNNVPPAPQRKFNKTLDLAKLQELADALIKDEIPSDPAAPQVQELLLLGTSMGAPVQKQSFKTMTSFGWRSSTNRTTAGTTHEWNMRCSGSLDSAGLMYPRAVSKRSAEKTFWRTRSRRRRRYGSLMAQEFDDV